MSFKFKQIDKRVVGIECEQGYKPQCFDTGYQPLPLNGLSDRDFERLIYQLYCREIADGVYNDIDNIYLMQGVAERGRDCTLLFNNNTCGLIQCKKYNERLTKPLVIKELIKFSLFCVLDESLIKGVDSFKYKLYVSNDMAGPAIEFAINYSKAIEEEYESIKRYMIGVIEDCAAFSIFSEKPPIDEVMNILRRFQFSYCNSVSISDRLNNYPDLLDSYFSIKKVIDLDAAEKIINNSINDSFENYGLKLMSDEDLRILQRRIGDLDDEFRVTYGDFEFYGYSHHILKNIDNVTFKELLKAFGTIRNKLNNLELSFIDKAKNKLIKEHITKLVENKKAHPIFTRFCMDYLFVRVCFKVMVYNIPSNQMASRCVPDYFLNDNELKEKIINILSCKVEKFNSGDYSDLNKIDFEQRIKLLSRIYQGLNSSEDVRTQIEKDLNLHFPILKSMLKELDGMIPKDKTIIIHNYCFLDDEYKLDKMRNKFNQNTK